MKKEKTALYIGDHKIGYRAKVNGQNGVLYKKGDEECFRSMDDLLLDILTGPCVERELSLEGL